MLPPTRRDVVLHFSRPEVGQLLLQRLRAALGDSGRFFVGALEQVPPDAVVVADDRALSLARCQELADTGHVPVVLAAFPSDADEAAYRRAGAHRYLGMMVDIAPLVAVLGALI
jgi:hypothetical protein